METWPNAPRRPDPSLATGKLLVVPAGGTREALAATSVAPRTSGPVFVGQEPAQRPGGLLVPPQYMPEPEPTDPPQARGPRAQALWESQHDLHEVAGLILLEEACRMVDRLDALHAVIAGDAETWASIVENRDLSFSSDNSRTVVYELHIDAAAGEARALAGALRALLTTLKAMPKRQTDEPETPDGVDDTEDEVTLMRNRNRRGTTGAWGTRGAGLDVQA